jgi:hypothetical protein
MAVNEFEDGLTKYKIGNKTIRRHSLCKSVFYKLKYFKILGEAGEFLS